VTVIIFLGVSMNTTETDIFTIKNDFLSQFIFYRFYISVSFIPLAMCLECSQLTEVVLV
jgi:hypothetical protein